MQAFSGMLRTSVQILPLQDFKPETDGLQSALLKQSPGQLNGEWVKSQRYRTFVDIQAIAV